MSTDINIVILMTGTVKPNSFTTLALKDPNVRRKQYIDAINFYLAKTNLKIVFVENSGVLLAKEFENHKHNNRLEFLTYNSIPTIPDKGKGAKELEIINYSFKHSKYISQSDAFIKITGRLKVLNIIELNSMYLSQSRRYKSVFSSNIYKFKKMDARCFFFTKDFLPHLNRLGNTVDLRYSIEMALWDSVLEYIKYDGTYKQMKQPLMIDGINAGFGTSYKDSFVVVIVKRIRHYFRVPYYYQKIRNENKLNTN